MEVICDNVLALRPLELVFVESVTSCIQMPNPFPSNLSRHPSYLLWVKTGKELVTIVKD